MRLRLMVRVRGTPGRGLSANNGTHAAGLVEEPARQGFSRSMGWKHLVPNGIASKEDHSVAQGFDAFGRGLSAGIVELKFAAVPGFPIGI